MVHDCTDWTATPPTRKIPLLLLARGDDRVYTAVPKEFKTLEQVARQEFGLGDVDILFFSACVNLCSGLPARITESAWEHISPYIGCATVEVSGPRAVEDQPPRDVPRKDQPNNDEDERDASAKRKLPLDADGNDNEQSNRGPGDRLSAPAREAVRDEKDAPSDREDDHDGASAPEDQHEGEEVSAVPPRKSRRVVSENEDEGDESEQERDVPAKSQAPPATSPPESSKEIEKERLGDYRPQPDPQPAEPPHQPSKPIKQEKRQGASESHSQHPHTESEFETQPRARAESRESYKVMIRVAHRPSKQESKFTTKSTTKVTKVLAGACKSFGLDASRATLYLIVSTEDEEGEMENLFPCDKNDTIARAGAEHDTESKFLLKVAGEA